jgi:3',5'-cyclic AMP phosphodiesterase CpdA
MWRLLALLLLVAGALAAFANSSGQFRFAIIGDRTGGAVPGVYEETWREVSAEHPDFVINVGDTIQGGNDATVDAEWMTVAKLVLPYRRCPLFLVPGNHDVWSTASAAAFQKFARHPLHYGFDYGTAHFTVLDNSRSDSLAPDEIQFLRQDMDAHEKQPVKFVFSHRPSWILQLVLANPNFPVHKIARQYNVKYVVAGHIHQMLRFHLDGITYVSMASSGGHLRAEKDYKDGWFFGYSLVSVKGDSSVNVTIKELGPPFGRSRQTDLERWGPAGLVSN